MTCNGPNSFETGGTRDTDPDRELAKECSRLQTFTTFPSHCPVSALTLARAGFFYTGEGDKVRCFSCHATVEGWQQGDSASGRHKTVSPNCAFISGMDCWRNGAHSALPNSHQLSEGCLANATWQQSSDPSSDLYADYLLRSGQVVDLSDSLYPRTPAMCSEEARLRSFRNWPTYAPVTPADLANAGLYYTGIADQVECFCCGGKLKNWEPSDQAWSEHRRHFPRCLFVLGRDVGNIENQSSNAELDRSEVHNASLPKNPSMAGYEARLKSFLMWRYLVSKEQLAQAGFYSIGDGDNVLCFYCGGGLREWRANDDPWEQHAQWFPGTKHLSEQQSVTSIYNIQLTHSLQDSTVSTSQLRGSITHRVDEELSQSHIVQDVMQMGFSLDEIRKAMERKRHLSTEHHRSIEALVADLINAQRENICSPSCESTLQRGLSTEEQLRRLQEEKLCKICMDKTISVVLIPCGHLVTCKDCAEAVEKCPLCCTVIAKRQKIYMS
ncbi:PREDICTED: E3 ubiquitin-protein ligase XIAP [Gekko japonicus]|uniref:E3 ubiquitin-protein ligase XIAP n=1 Tax=Gekko japonicus TaxID=146911 RepID=A0ABM1L938_GEKJA|nr:PREDICTED: E3 ubiquitin-protein ligase XIAP [Gekko japonicus]